MVLFNGGGGRSDQVASTPLGPGWVRRPSEHEPDLAIFPDPWRRHLQLTWG